MIQETKYKRGWAKEKRKSAAAGATLVKEAERKLDRTATDGNCLSDFSFSVYT